MQTHPPPPVTRSRAGITPNEGPGPFLMREITPRNRRDKGENRPDEGENRRPQIAWSHTQTHPRAASGVGRNETNPVGPRPQPRQKNRRRLLAAAPWASQNNDFPQTGPRDDANAQGNPRGAGNDSCRRSTS